MFGTKKILAKIINGKLVIRVGGGYMNAEEFIEQYGKIEMMKLMKMEENKNQESSRQEETKTLNSSRSSFKLGVGEQKTVMAVDYKNLIQDKLRQSLMTIKQDYESTGSALKEGVKKTSHIKTASTFEM
jgi:hypothetical protein